MATASILYVGDDLCHRIPVMENAGLFVVRSKDSLAAVESALAVNKALSVITFHSDNCAPPESVVLSARRLTSVPLILFEGSSAQCNERLFDHVVFPQTPPAVWLKVLQETIEKSRNLRKASQQLREECTDTCATTKDLRAKSEELLAKSEDLQAKFAANFFSGESEGEKE